MFELFPELYKSKRKTSAIIAFYRSSNNIGTNLLPGTEHPPPLIFIKSLALFGNS